MNSERPGRGHRSTPDSSNTRFTGSFPAAPVARYLAAVRPAQDALGERQDLLVAQSLFEAQLPADSRAWFAVGWLAARRAQAVARCGETLARVARAPPFWRGRAGR